MKTILVAGAGGAIGGHLVKRLYDRGDYVIAVDKKPLDEWWRLHGVSSPVSNFVSDLSTPEACARAVRGVDEVYMLAADMGGMGFIETHKAECMLSVLISTNMLVAARDAGVSRFFFSSSACVYPDYLQDTTNAPALAEYMAYPAAPEDGYGWEKLFTERMCRHFNEDFGLETRVGRYHNVYGPFGSWTGGREKAPAAICRKVIEAGPGGSIDIWGDGEQTRSFMYVEDCVTGTTMLMDSDYSEPLNIGSSELVTINKLVDIVEQIAGFKVIRKYDLSKPQGVRGRNSDNTEILSVFDWEPSTSLEDGLTKTYRWIYNQIKIS